MKKSYIRPVSEAIDLQPEGMIAASGDPGKNDELGNGQWHAPQRGWNSDMWSHMNETDDNQEDL